MGEEDRGRERKGEKGREEGRRERKGKGGKEDVNLKQTLSGGSNVGLHVYKWPRAWA